MKINNNIFFKSCLIILSSLGNFLIAQTSISGTIMDSLNNPIGYANILIKPAKSDIITLFTHSETDGSYNLITNEIGEFEISFTAISYKSKIEPIYLEKGKKIIQNIKLKNEVVELNEVIIAKENPITIINDTITFLAKSFMQGNEQVVEDLLKKIPGLNISSEGTIKIGNQEVEKVMIDGDDFFDKGYKILTKNMPVNPVEKVEIYQHYSNNKHLKGVENSDKVALNLTLKEDAKRHWFGNMSLGYGIVSKNRYEVRSNLMNFGKKNKYYFITNLNNIGFDATGDIDNIIRPFHFDEPGSIGDEKFANSFLSLGAGTPNLKKKRVNFNNAEILSLNSIFTLSPKVKLKIFGFLNSDENDFFKNNFQSYSIGTTNFENTEKIIGRKTKTTGFGKVDLTYDISKNKTLEYTGKFNTTIEKNSSILNFNGDLFDQKLKNNNQLFDHKIVLTTKFEKNEVVLISGRYINEKTPQNFAVNQFIYEDLFSAKANNIVQTSENRMQFAGFEAHLLDRKTNGDLVEIKFGNQFRKDDLQSQFQIKKDVNIIAEPTGYQNNLSYSSTDLYLNTKYRFKLKNISLLTQVDFHQLFNMLETAENTQNQKPFFINPKVGLEWEINKKNKISNSYSINKTNATILDVYNNYIQRSFRSFSKGTGNFNQFEASTVLLNYTYGSWSDKFFANTFLLYSKNNDFFSTNTFVTQNYSQSEKIVIKDREFLTFSSNIDRYFKAISSNLKLTFGGSKSNYKNIVNNSDLREVKSENLNYGFEFRSGFHGFFNYHIGSKWNYDAIKATITNSYTDNMTFLDLSFMMSDTFHFQIETERYYFGNLDKQRNKYYFMDLEARYVVKKDKLTFSLSGNNLFNTNTFKSYTISDISISKTEYRLQPRYALLKMEFRF